MSEQEIKENEVEEITKETNPKKEKKINKDKKEIEKLNLKIKEIEEKNIRVTAEMVNFRRRKEEEVEKMLKFANEDIIIDMLEVIDNFERALNVTNESSEEIQKYLNGIKMIYNSLLNILNKYDVKEIEALGKEFDSNIHQAVMTGHDDNAKENEIIEVFQKGYTYKEKVIRPAMVKVNQ